MLKTFLFSILFLCSNSIIFSQDKISINIGFGYYLSNSDNSTEIMSGNKYKSFLLYGFSYQRNNVFGFNLIFEYSYQQITKEHIIEFIRYSPGPGPMLPPYWGSVKLISNNFDLDYNANIGKYFSYGIGPSFIIVNRILSVDTVLYDKLASSGFGLNCFAELSAPIYGNKDYVFFTSKLKFRYTHSIWFDKGIRDLNNYNQGYFTVQILAGVGYAF